MRYEELNFTDAVEAGKIKPFILVYGLSGVRIGRWTGADELNLDEALEVRFFDEQEEIRLFHKDGEWHAVSITGDGKGIRKTFAIQNPIFGNSISVSQELDTDEDGQTFIKTVRLTEWKERAES